MFKKLSIVSFLSLLLGTHFLTHAVSSTISSTEITEYIDNHTTLDGKFYVEPESVFVCPKMIFIEIQGNLIQTPAIFSDEEGIFIEEYQLAQALFCLKCKRWYDPSKQYYNCPHN